MEKCRNSGIRKVIYASSGGTIYGNNIKANREDDKTEPINHYGICKLTCEKILMLYNKLYGMNNVVLRLANPYGKYQRIESGVGVITALTVEAITNNRLCIWGDGENIRDFIDVRDVAKAFIKAISWNGSEKLCTPIFNVGSGIPISVNQVIQIIGDTLGKKLETNYMPARKFDVRSNYLDMCKAEKYLGLSTSADVKNDIKRHVKSIERAMNI